MSGNDDLDRHRKDYRKPYGPKKAIPTVQQYLQNKATQRAELEGDEADSPTSHGRMDAAKDWWYGSNKDEPDQEAAAGKIEPEGIYHAAKPSNGKQSKEGDHEGGDVSDESDHGSPDQTNHSPTGPKDTSQVDPGAADPKQRRKQMKKRKAKHMDREVTDPVTHLPITIRDYNEKELNSSAEDEGYRIPPAVVEKAEIQGKEVHRDGRRSSDRRSSHDLDDEQQIHDNMELRFPPPEYGEAREELGRVYAKAMTVSLASIVSICASTQLLWSFTSRRAYESLSTIPATILSSFVPLCGISAVGAVVWVAQGWVQKRAESTWEGEVWHAQKVDMRHQLELQSPESTLWLNKILQAIWPLVNPDLFISIADTLEDIMQASLPKLVRMVSVEDIGQGSESLRILGMKWLPKGDANRTVTDDNLNDEQEDEKKEKDETKQQANTQNQPSQNVGQTSQDQEDDTEKDGNETGAGLNAEEGEFVNLELGFAYRANRTQKKIRDRARNAHLLLAFYLPGNIKIPVWVELKGIVGTMRARLQLTSDPPFLGMATITLLGQPKVEMSCVPLVRSGLNLMDVPLISSFTQSSIDAALAEMVAPKSMTLDLKAMLAGDDFKKDTDARGVLVVYIHRAYDFKVGDTKIPLISDGSSDGYIMVGWAKFGKPLWSSRIITNDQEPYWEEVAQILVGPEELDADERLRVQLWDSDRVTIDDDLGRIELDLKMLMRNEKSNGKMWHRYDGFRSLKAGETMPGKLDWEVGYFSKTRLLDSQVKEYSGDENVQNIDQLREKVYAQAEKKMRETAKEEKGEVEQLKEQDFEEAQIDMISSAPPLEDYPTGILSVQIHQILGLQLRDPSNADTQVQQLDEDSSLLPDSYCTLILNHQKIFRTRTKPKNISPFFNAGTERFIRDWRNTDLFIGCRDARVHEDDALIGCVHIQLGEFLRRHKASRYSGFFPLAGGVGYGRVRLSIVFRSVQDQSPPRPLGWDIGTLRVEPEVVGTDGLPKSLASHRLKLRTDISAGKVHPQKLLHHSSEDQVVWKPKGNRPLMLPVHKRFRTNLVVEFRSSGGLFRNSTPAFCVLWLHQIPDNQEQELTLPVFGDHTKMKRATANVLPIDQCGEKIGSLKLKVKFMPGFSRKHSKLAKGDVDAANVMELIEAAYDNGDIDALPGASREGEDTADIGDHDDSDDSDDDNSKLHSSSDKHKAKDSSHEHGTSVSAETDDTLVSVHQDNGASPSSSKDEGSDETGDGSLSHMHRTIPKPVKAIEEYTDHQRELHRQQRGVMQFKGPRSLKWMKHKAEGAAKRFSGSFDHSNREPGVESES